MSILTIVVYPHPTLRKVAQPITEITPEIKKLAQDMLDTMYVAEGVGLAANQVNILKRIIVMDTSEQRNSPIIIINPQIIAHSEEMDACEEGCLSFPEVREGPITRPKEVTVQGLGLDGELFTIELSDLLARCVQHEIDHLDGKVYVDYLSALKRERLIKKMNKLIKEKKLEDAQY